MARPKASGDLAKVAHTVSITKRARALADQYKQERGFKEGISDFSQIVERALIAYCSGQDYPVKDQSAEWLAAEDPPKPATLAKALAAKERAEEAQRKMTHAQNTTPAPRPRSHPGKGLPVQPKG